MSRAIAFSVFSLLLFVCTDVLSQEDNWWRKLFRKDATEEVIAPEPRATSKEAEPALDSLSSGLEAEKDTAMSTEQQAFTRAPGNVLIVLPEGMAALDSLYRETPPAIRGYRIQVYFGDLGTAREQRRMCMESLPDLPCYLVQNPPSFAVMLGDYRTHLDAYRDALTLGELYPSAVVVPSSIEPPALQRGVKEQ